MERALLCSLAGAGIGFASAFPIVGVMTGGESARDTAAITLFVGTFLSGTGAIAGAIVGRAGSAQTRQQARIEQTPRESPPGV